MKYVRCSLTSCERKYEIDSSSLPVEAFIAISKLVDTYKIRHSIINVLHNTRASDSYALHSSSCTMYRGQSKPDHNLDLVG
jgi:hypothetical protein